MSSICNVWNCTRSAVHAELWADSIGYRLWCEEHVPRVGHRPVCGETCSELLKTIAVIKGDTPWPHDVGRKLRESEERHAAIGREVLRLWQRATAERHSKQRLGDDIDNLMCWGTEAEREARRLAREKATEYAEISRYWAE